MRVTQTCSACPSQWDITLSDGRYVYARYRWGCLSFADTPGGDPFWDERLGDRLDGTMDTDTMLSHLMTVVGA